MTQSNLILILGDQLTPSLSSLAQADAKSDIVLMAEVSEEATYVRHHKKKIAFVFSAMRHFAAELEEKGWKVVYVRLDDADNSGHLAGEVARVRAEQGLERVIVTEPGEIGGRVHPADAGVRSGEGLAVLKPLARSEATAEGARPGPHPIAGGMGARVGVGVTGRLSVGFLPGNADAHRPAPQRGGGDALD